MFNNIINAMIRALASICPKVTCETLAVVTEKTPAKVLYLFATMKEQEVSSR